ncbi:MAG: hypothetical protein AAB441_00775 [Patescibacteria group bacterium]
MKTLKSILITRPNHDLITTYLYYWSQPIIKEAMTKNIQTFDLSGKKANRSLLTSYIEKHNPIFIHFNGHGSNSLIAGYDNEILIEANKNDKLLAQKIIYALSCDSAKILGYSCIKNGALVFIGYKRKYILAYDIKSYTRPLKDKLAKLFLEPSNLVTISILKGNTVGNAFQKSQDSMRRHFLYMISTKATALEKDASSFLWANKKGQTLIGDENSKLI